MITRTYALPKDTDLCISRFDGETMTYIVADSLEELEQEKAKIKKIDDDYQEKYQRYLLESDEF